MSATAGGALAVMIVLVVLGSVLSRQQISPARVAPIAASSATGTAPSRELRMLDDLIRSQADAIQRQAQLPPPRVPERSTY